MFNTSQDQLSSVAVERTGTIHRLLEQTVVRPFTALPSVPTLLFYCTGRLKKGRRRA
jgi:hypothetical protein